MAQSSSKTIFLCNNCGNEYSKWHGQCPACSEWGTLSEFNPPKSRRKSNGAPAKETTELHTITHKKDQKRSSSGLSEVDRVLGGGLLTGSMILLGGQPGIGKSTLALQIVAGCGEPALYVSAEESEDQLALRAERLGIKSKDLHVSGENEILNVLEQVSVVKPSLLVIDSIQTVYNEDLDSLPGSSRPILVEVQALVSKANFGTPQRNTNGIDGRRLSMLLAVLEKRLGNIMGMNDVFVNLVGGLKIQDPAADLAIISAVASSSKDNVIADGTVLVGEVGLTGEVRSVARIDQRLQEAAALGFKKAIIPATNLKNKKSFNGLKIHGVKTVREAFQYIF